jgi:hypothetical protein
MLERNAMVISRALGCLWLVAAASTGLLAIWNLPLLIWWPLGLFALGLLTMSTANVPAVLILIGGAVVTVFAVWVASGSTAGNENFAHFIAAGSAALAVASASARALLRRRAHVTLRDAN